MKRLPRLLGAGVLAAAALLGLAWLAHLDFSRKISTDVLDLLPGGDDVPELSLVRTLASEAEARTMLFLLTDGAGRPVSEAATRRFAAELARRPAFAQALSLGDTALRDAVGAELFGRRFTLLFPFWLQERRQAYAATGGDAARLDAWLADDAVRRLNGFLAAPEALAFADALPSDPLLLVPAALDRLKTGLTLLQPGETAGSASRVWARIAASPLSEEGQQPVFRAIDEATAATRAAYPGLTVAATGVNRFAAASKARIRSELSWLNALSLAGVLAVALLFIRRPQRGLHLVPPVLFAMLGAWVCVTLVFARIHILVFVIGALLTGVAIDYGFYLYMQAPAFPGEDYWSKVRRLRKPLASSCLTTVAGFSLLLFSDLPLIRQLGVFVGAGLLCALASAVVYFSLLPDTVLRARSFAGARRPSAPARRAIRRTLLALWLAALPGIFLLHWRDDVRELEVPTPEVERNDQRVRGEFDGGGERTVFLTQGPTLAEARSALERFDAWLRRTEPPGAAFANLGAIIPTAASQVEAVRFLRGHPGFPERLREALRREGFDPDGFSAFFADYERAAATASAADLATAAQALQSRLAGPLSLLLHLGRPPVWFATLAAAAPPTSPPPETRTVAAGQLQSLNRLFAQYRRSALGLSLTGLGLVGAGVLLAYGVRDGARIFAIPAGACLGLFGLFGWLGQPLNLFHLLGAFLGVCLTHNYSIFSATSAYRREPPPASVRLSALTTFASFGALAFSGIPVVRALGETVALMVLAALLTIELEHFAPIVRKS